MRGGQQKKKTRIHWIRKKQSPLHAGHGGLFAFFLQRNVLIMSLLPIGSVYTGNTMRSDWSNFPDRNYSNYSWPLATAWGVRRRRRTTRFFWTFGCLSIGGMQFFFLALVMSLVPTTKDPKKLPEKIAKKRAPASCATIRLLTFHYRQIFTRLLAQVGFARAPSQKKKTAQKRTPAS